MIERDDDDRESRDEVHDADEMAMCVRVRIRLDRLVFTIIHHHHHYHHHHHHTIIIYHRQNP